jgi:hypothetical protein
MAFRRHRQREATGTPAPESLGAVSCPTGDLVVLDFGMLRLWSGDDEPLLDPETVPPDLAALANGSADFEIVGPDAAEVAAGLNLAAVNGRFAFDMPDDGALISGRVATMCASTGLRARVEGVDRMPHRQRVLRLLDEYPEGVEVPFHGMWSVALRGVPRDRRLPVLGRRMDPDGADAYRWHAVWVQVSDAEPVSAVEVGVVLVDEARLMFADPTALSAWISAVSLDGLADLVFWGRDAALVADRASAPLLQSGGSESVGWADRPVTEIIEHGRRVAALHSDPSLKFAFDVRPHDDHHRLLSIARASPTGSGTIDVGGMAVTGFFTTWGDGAFPVFRDLDASGSTCRIRVDFIATPTP